MTDDEIVAAFKKADELMAEYITTIRPAAVELARRKSEAVFGKPGLYDGHLGCFESGKDCVCLHITAEGMEIVYQAGGMVGGSHHDKACDFEYDWGQKLDAAGISLVHLSGHY